MRSITALCSDLKLVAATIHFKIYRRETWPTHNQREKTKERRKKAIEQRATSKSKAIVQRPLFANDDLSRRAHNLCLSQQLLTTPSNNLLPQNEVCYHRLHDRVGRRLRPQQGRQDLHQPVRFRERDRCPGTYAPCFACTVKLACDIMLMREVDPASPMNPISAYAVCSQRRRYDEMLR